METRRIADQLRRAGKGPCWHGPAVIEAITGLDANHAAEKPLGFNHSIWELLLHCCTWQSAAMAALNGTPLNVDDEEDFPGVPARDLPASWDAGREYFESGCESLAAAVERLPDSKLADVVPGREYDFYFLLHGVVQHNLYHAGQMMQLRRFLENNQR